MTSLTPPKVFKLFLGLESALTEDWVYATELSCQEISINTNLLSMPGRFSYCLVPLYMIGKMPYVTFPEETLTSALKIGH